MRNLLFFDVESTGLLDFNVDLMHPTQPRVCALAAVLTDNDGNIIDEMDVLIKPEGWDIEPGAAAVNNLTKEICEERGIPMRLALDRFNEMKANCQVRVGANVSYDKRLMAREAIINDMVHNSDGLESVCVLQLARPYAQIPNVGKKGFKTPKLTEAYKALIGEDMPNAHGAMGDVRGAMAVYFHIMGKLRAVEGVA
jgi:DNA polymerase-3 subunit epsilon